MFYRRLVLQALLPLLLPLFLLLHTLIKDEYTYRLVPTLIRVLPTTCVIFVTYENCRYYLRQQR